MLLRILHLILLRSAVGRWAQPHGFDMLRFVGWPVTSRSSRSTDDRRQVIFYPVLIQENYSNVFACMCLLFYVW